MKSEVINIQDKMTQINEFWKPKIIEQMNDTQLKLVKIKGEFTWHKHDETDEIFYVLKGSMTIKFRDKDAVLKAGELYVVPKGVEHKPVAENECEVMLIEPAGTVNTGDSVDVEMLASNKDWI